MDLGTGCKIHAGLQLTHVHSCEHIFCVHLASTLWPVFLVLLRLLVIKVIIFFLSTMTVFV